MQSKPTNRSISMSTLADELQQSYGDYKRKKKSSFVKSVEKAYKLVSAEWSSNEEEEDDLLSKWERNYLNQKKGKSSDASESEKNTDESFSSDIETYIAYEEPNSLNNFMSNMYQYSTPVQTGRKNDVGGSQQQQQKPVSVNKTQQIFQRRQLPASSEVHSQTHKRIAAPDINEFSGNTPRKKQNRMKALSTTDPSVQKSDSNKEMLVDVGTSAKQFRKDGKMKSKESKNSHMHTSSVTFSDIGGNDTCLKEICKLLVHMKHPEVYVQLGVVPPRGILLHGPPGCGKTLLAHAIAGELQLPFIKIAATEIVSGVSGDSEQKVRELFDTAVASAPCIMFIDEIDAITPKRETASKDMERRIVAQLLACLDDLSSKSSQHVMVIGATNRPDSLDPALRRAGRFDREISLGIPDESSRKRILQVLCKNLRLTENFNFHHLARQTPGFVGADLGSLTREAAMIAVNRVFNELKESTVEEKISQENAPDSSRSTDLLSVLSWLRDQPPLTEDQLHNLHISLPDFEEALKHVQPSAKREGFATIPDVTWNDIGALHEIREELQLAILVRVDLQAPVKYPEKFKALGLCNPPGILLAGPPGCGKTLLAKAVANESGINFISVKGPELLNMYVGESERAVRQVFQRGRNSSPCVIFFDELDALCPRRSDAGESGSSARVVNQMLTEMDGLEDRKQVFIMAATNRPDIIDPAILRPGRLDKILYVGLPTAADRLDILNTITKHQTKPVMAEDISLKDASKDKRCEGFTGADLAALVREASINALKDSISNSSALAIQVNKEHLEAAFKKVKPSVSEKDQLKYEKMRLYHQIL